MVSLDVAATVSSVCGAFQMLVAAPGTGCITDVGSALPATSKTVAMGHFLSIRGILWFKLHVSELCFLFEHPPRQRIGSQEWPIIAYHWGEGFDGGKIGADRFGSPPSYQIFVRMLCAKMRPMERGSFGGGVDSKNSQTTPTTANTTSICQLLGAADAQTAQPATSSTAPAHQPLGSANAETTPAGAPCRAP